MEMKKWMEALRGKFAGQDVADSSPNESERNDERSAQQRREELEAMSAEECMLSIFGKERVDKFLQNTHNDDPEWME